MNTPSNMEHRKSRAAFPQAERSTAEAARAGRSPELHQERAVQTRLQVLEAAATLFDQRGYAGTSIKNVAEQVGMTKGAVYFHYPTKEALTIAVVEAHYARWPSLLKASQSKGLGSLDTLIDLLDQTAVAFQDDPIVRGGARLQMEQPLPPGTLPTPYVGWIDLLRQLLTEAQEAGELRAGIRPEAAAHTLLATFFGTQHISARLDRRSELVQRWTDSRDLVFYALRA
ncbi:TetR/AcrR family transcriptional regulator (plasmid) [Streptomyces sp. NBC_01003]|uniref:ScbR family autoregulator-binding transcription factor n=1 Tax=Streptomyces sp. NBC_01003 TaxID=2903714 RepID=UPI002F916A55|nr:TetR/AcrR family transcriptional regulator [Streptomyces sp. NBC_01003]